MSDAPVPKRGKGRPSKYDPSFAKIAERMCMLGATDTDLADALAVNVRTIERWKGEHEDFCRALQLGKDYADDRVERSLYQKAVGYQTDAVKIFMPAGKDEPVYAPYRENVQPDTASAIFWLKNRRPDKWRDRHDYDHTHTHTISEEFETFIRKLAEQPAHARMIECEVIPDAAE